MALSFSDIAAAAIAHVVLEPLLETISKSKTGKG
jgi:hypothetical protein